MIDYISEKLADKFYDKVKEEKENLNLRNKLFDYLKRQKEEFDQSEYEYDFDALMHRIEASLLNDTTIRNLTAVDSEKRNRTKERIRISCVQAALSIDGIDGKETYNTDTSAKSDTYGLSEKDPIHVTNRSAAQQKVEGIVNQLFNIIEEFYDSKNSKPAKMLAIQIVDTVDSHADGIKTELKQGQNEIKEKLDRILEIDTHVSPQQPSAPDRKQADNRYYLDHFTEPLFLEDDDESPVTLASMYVSPQLKDKEESAADCITQWFHSRTIKKCMLLFGGAGVGKSSLVSKIISDANSSTENREFQFDVDQVLAVALRNHYDKIDWTKDADEILLTLFSGYDEEHLKNKLLILDGLDEVCVLLKGFDGHGFLEKLMELENGFHVLVTSRAPDGYFSNPSDIQNLLIRTLKWTEQEVERWCYNYVLAKQEKQTWCEGFTLDYKKLPDEDEDKNDHRKEVFSVPIILYICGNSEILLSDHKNIGSVYNTAFRKILLRSHQRGQKNGLKLAEANRKNNLIAWQYTKEIAYQMFLYGTLDLADSNDTANKYAIGLKNAKDRTKAILHDKNGSDWDVSESELDFKSELALCPFTKENRMGGVTFAHKTVRDYFTAVKLYEDYFAKFNADYFNEHTDSVNKEVIESFVEAFRYAALTPDILTFLINMDSPAFSSDRIDSLSPQKTPENRMFDKKKFLDAFVSGIKENQFGRLGIQPPVEEYLVSDLNILEQISLAFCNFTWFCTGVGYRNIIENRADIEKIIKELSYSPKIICCQDWEMQGADLEESKLKKATMLRANLREADLRNSVLSDAHFNGAHLERAHLEGAHLEGTSFNNAHLKEAHFDFSYLLHARFKAADCERTHFESADLRGAHFEGAILSNARLKKSILNGAFFINANLKCSNFENAVLNRTSFLGSHLEGAIFNGCSLDDAYLKGAMYDESTIFPDGFNPKERGMIEVDVNGDPIE